MQFMSEYDPTVYIVDDDATLRESLQWLLESIDLPTKAFASGGEFLADCPDGAQGCILLDVRMPGNSGLNVLSELKENGVGIPVLFITGHGDVPMCVQAFKGGAVDFIEKPCNDQMLLDSVQRALEQDRERFQAARYRRRVNALVHSLTPRERDVFRPLAQGKSTRAIAEELDLSPKTVEAYRGRVMNRLGTRNISELVRLAVTAGVIAEEVEV